MGKRREPEYIPDLEPDVIVVLGDDETWTYLSGCSLVIAPRGTFTDDEGGLVGDKPLVLAKRRKLKAPYGVVALDTLIRHIPLSKLAEYLTVLDHVPPPASPPKGKK